MPEHYPASFKKKWSNGFLKTKLPYSKNGKKWSANVGWCQVRNTNKDGTPTDFAVFKLAYQALTYTQTQVFELSFLRAW